MESIYFSWFTKEDAQFQQVYDLRYQVFVCEQGFSLAAEFDEQDAKSQHVLLLLQDRALGSARIFFDDVGVLHVGRVVLSRACRGKGWGLLLMEEVHRKAKSLGAKDCVLNAQEDKQRFYRRAGYTAVGEIFLEDNYPHIEMRRSI